MMVGPPRREPSELFEGPWFMAIPSPRLGILGQGKALWLIDNDVLRNRPEP